MAGDWISLRPDLADDPAVIAIAAAINDPFGRDIDAFGVVGRLHRLWSWYVPHLLDGNTPTVTEKWVDCYLQATGFAAAMIAVGWLEQVKTGNIENRFRITLIEGEFGRGLPCA